MGGSVNTENIRHLESMNTNLQVAYETLNTTMKSITEQTNDLPDIQAALKTTDNSIARAFSNITAIETSPTGADQVSDKLNRLADETKAKATGRTGPFAGIGAAIGAVGGGAAGFFFGGKNVKSALIGVGAGTALAAGIGALIGHSIDQGYVGEAQALEKLAGDVKRYNPEGAKTQLLNSTQQTYGEILNARDKHDLDNARVVTNNLNKIQGTVAPIEQESQRILDAYKK